MLAGNAIHQGDCLALLRQLEESTVDCVVTSPPYWGLRDYGVPGQLGLESKPEEYIAHLAQVFGEVRRILKPTGTLWLNLGDWQGRARGSTRRWQPRPYRRRRTVWTVTSRPYHGPHFAGFPPGLVEPCVQAGCPAGGLVLDPFAGTGTVGEVALRLGRRWMLFELNPKYVELARQRIAKAAGE